MKELTVEQKAKRYDEALEIINDYYQKIKYSSLSNASTDREVLEKAFPQLKESDGEDERIVKELLTFFRESVHGGHILTNKEYDSWIAWLEKQGQKPQGKSALDAAQEEKVDNQNCVKPADIVEPKFKNGQWIIWQDKCYKVNDNGCGYELVDQNGLSTSLEYGTVEESAYLWDVTSDAKDGDVLASNRSIFIFSQEYIAGKPEAHCGIMNGLFLVKPEGCWTNEKCYPATKEQRDLLFQKMKEAGYEWDFEKKELKKIEHKPADESKIKPKFKTGDRVIGIVSGMPYFITEVCNDHYNTESGCIIMFCSQDNFELYEQKPADKVELGKKFTPIESALKDLICDVDNSYTIEQVRRFLFEYGYKDKILNAAQEEMQKPAEWSEEDEEYLNDIIRTLRNFVVNGGSVAKKYTEEEINWLKSLRLHAAWKPSDNR